VLEHKQIGSGSEGGLFDFRIPQFVTLQKNSVIGSCDIPIESRPCGRFKISATAEGSLFTVAFAPLSKSGVEIGTGRMLDRSSAETNLTVTMLLGNFLASVTTATK